MVFSKLLIKKNKTHFLNNHRYQVFNEHFLSVLNADNNESTWAHPCKSFIHAKAHESPKESGMCGSSGSPILLANVDLLLHPLNMLHERWQAETADCKRNGKSM